MEAHVSASLTIILFPKVNVRLAAIFIHIVPFAITKAV
jgi:hypothetical protein